MKSLIIKSALVITGFGLVVVTASCNDGSSTPDTIDYTSPTTELPTWTPPLVLSPITPPEGSVSLPGGIKVIPSVASPWPDVPAYQDVYALAEIKTGGEFSIGLDASFQLGVSWSADFDGSVLALVAEETAYYGQVQRLGTQWFRFKAISKGIAVITFDLTSSRISGDAIVRLPFTISVVE